MRRKVKARLTLLNQDIDDTSVQMKYARTFIEITNRKSNETVRCFNVGQVLCVLEKWNALKVKSEIHTNAQ